jgi:stage III sporulation protein AA
MNIRERTCLPLFLQELLVDVPPALHTMLEEVRIRRGRPIELLSEGRSLWLEDKIVDETICRNLLDKLTHHSVYSFEEQLRRGFITTEGGHRVGLCGQVILQDGNVKLIRDVTSFNIRIARQVKGIANRLLHYLYDGKQQRYFHTLIISPPQHGKTTLLRELTRMASNGYEFNMQAKVNGCKVALIDERSELAGAVQGVPTFDVGMRTDVLDHCPKAEGMMMMIRSMSPQLIVVDEIGQQDDAHALKEAMLAGVSVFATAHGAHLLEVMNRPLFKAIHDLRLFERYVVLQRRAGVNLYMRVYDANGENLASITELKQ